MFPHMVSIIDDENNLCGGFIISDRHIVTAASCVKDINDPKHLVVSGGSTMLNDGKIIKISEIKKHPLYDPITTRRYAYDVAVMKTMNHMTFDDYMNMIELPQENEVVAVSSRIVVAGWGEPEEDYYSEELRKVTLVVNDIKDCNETDHEGQLTDHMLCAGNKRGRAACWGDTGGAAVQNSKAVGIILDAPSCGVPSMSSLFTNVASPAIRAFIMNETGI
ncbi:hypothetical protein ABMA28_005439 [Loxostege sticticalis]|uniref:Peptidase S1 domain-containing protein n=1 Tax=Loxostege sticticalis TaxID=481309 RepID=A0ABD0SSU2_LOXSC